MRLPYRVSLLASLLASTLGAQVLVIPTSVIGDPHNAAQSAANRNHAFSGGDGRGAVGYTYHIGTTSVTNNQYVAFLNAVAATDTHGLFRDFMETSSHGGIQRSGSDGSYTYSAKPGMGDMPVVYVNFFDAARFANWLTNGQPSGAQGVGTTETGVYNLGGVTNPVNTSVVRDAAAWAAGGVAIASEDEWFKAAYYNPATGFYSLYGTGSDTAPTTEAPPGGSNSANISGALSTLTIAGAYADSTSHYGVHDMVGNSWDWVETILFTTNRRFLGGSFEDDLSEGRSAPSGFNHGHATTEWRSNGFRVTSLQAIPEPSTYAALLGLGALALVSMRRFRR